MDRAELARRLGATGGVEELRDTVVCEADPAKFVRAFTAAVAAGGTVFVADPAWGEAERAQVARCIQTPASAVETSKVSRDAPGDGWLCLPTGGSSGRIKLARHDEATLAAAVNGFCGHFGVRRVSAIGLLPLHHVSGLMAWLRCVLTGGTYRAWSWPDVERGRRPELPPGEVFLSLVPTQLERLLRSNDAVDWLRRFRAVFIGGGPAWPTLMEQAADARLPLAFTYGTTETAAMLTALRPEEFLAGGRGSGRALPHARVTIESGGRIRIEAESLFRGYWPDRRDPGPWFPEDVGEIDAAGSLHVHGRRDALIITGGEKVHPGEVEAVLRATGLFPDVVVLGVPDRHWGAVVVACHPEGPALDRAVVEQALTGRLAKFKWPKRYVPVEPWPRNAQGKVSRERLREALDRAGPA